MGLAGFRKRQWPVPVEEGSPLFGEVEIVTVRHLNNGKVDKSQADSYAAMREARGTLYDTWRDDVAARNAAAAKLKAEGGGGSDEDEAEKPKTYGQRVRAVGHYPDTLARFGVVSCDDETMPTDDAEIRAYIDDLPAGVVDYLAFLVADKNGLLAEAADRPTGSSKS